MERLGMGRDSNEVLNIIWKIPLSFYIGQNAKNEKVLNIHYKICRMWDTQDLKAGRVHMYGDVACDWGKRWT